MSWLHILALMMPVLLPVALGRLFIRFGLFQPEHGDALLKYLLYATFPAVILDHLVDQPLPLLFQPAFTAATLVFIGILYSVVLGIYRYLLRRSLGQSAMAALNGCFVSAGIVGLPLMLDLIGPGQTIVPVIVNTVLSLMTAVPLTILLLQWERSRTGARLLPALARTLVDVLKNPLVFAALLGLAISLARLPVPAWLHESLAKVGAATFATALFAVGMGIDLSLLRRQLGSIVLLSLLRVGLGGALGFLLALRFQLPPGQAVAFVLMAALPTAKSIPPIAREYGVFVGESFQVVTLTTLAMAPVIPVICYLADALWPGIIR